MLAKACITEGTLTCFLTLRLRTRPLQSASGWEGSYTTSSYTGASVSCTLAAASSITARCMCFVSAGGWVGWSEGWRVHVHTSRLSIRVRDCLLHLGSIEVPPICVEVVVPRLLLPVTLRGF